LGLPLQHSVFNTSEFAPIALLSDIAKGFSISEAKAGLLITIYAWVVALASLPLILIFARVERRKLMAGLLILFIISHLLSWQSY
jgi:DHA1 family L-arabinose/isopropyl-beta-D-thiogalactopyranoside export protein-like MFS transporter